MSDDWSLSHWFRDDDDWIESLVSIIRDSLWDPVPVTFSQLREFLDELTNASQRAGGKVDLRTLESVARSYDMAGLPAASLFSLAALTEREAGRKDKGGVLANVPLSQVSSILRPKAGRLRVPDIIGIVKLASKQAGRADVFDGLDLNAVVDAVPQRALRGCTLGELRTTMEGLAAAGPGFAAKSSL
jgi:hypothetical protein